MQKETTAGAAELTEGCDEELCDVLIAISVVAKRLAKKISENRESKEDGNVQALRTDGKDRQG